MSKNYFEKTIRELHENPMDKEMELTVSIVVPPNMPIGNGTTNITVQGAARQLAAFGIQACVDVICRSVVDSAKRNGIPEHEANTLWSFLAADLLEYIYKSCELFGEKNGLKLENLHVGKYRPEELVEAVVDAMNELSAEKKESLH